MAGVVGDFDVDFFGSIGLLLHVWVFRHDLKRNSVEPINEEDWPSKANNFYLVEISKSIKTRPGAAKALSGIGSLRPIAQEWGMRGFPCDHRRCRRETGADHSADALSTGAGKNGGMPDVRGGGAGSEGILINYKIDVNVDLS